VTVLVIALACLAGVLWYAESRRTRSALPPSQPGPPPAASLTFEALVDSAASLEARFRLEMDSVPRDDDTRRLQSTIAYLKKVTYTYYDWAMAQGAASPSAETITSEYLLPAVESVLEARPELASGRAGLRSHAIVRLYFFDRRMLLSHGVIHASSGLGRFPSLELAPIVKETPLDRVVWGRRIDAVGFALRDPVIFDIVSYSHGVSTGANMVTLGTIVCHYLDREADFIGLLRDEVLRARQRTPPPPLDADRMMEGLAYVALQPYMSLDVEGAVTAFMEDWRETSYIHEVGHIFSKEAGLALTSQSGEEEALAYLTELRYGGAPHYTLHAMYNAGVVQGIRPHEDGMRIVFAEFARHIRYAKSRGDGLEAIDVGTPAEQLTNDGIDRIAYQFPKLRTDEIRALADRIFEEKYRPRVKE
jgi:hypothetical protein